jgi:hypothetical protein
LSRGIIISPVIKREKKKITEEIKIMTTMIKKIVAAYKEVNMEVLCGALIMNGTSTAYQTYRSISK